MEKRDAAQDEARVRPRIVVPPFTDLMSRRRVLQAGVTGLAVVGLGPILSACNSSSTVAPSAGTGTGPSVSPGGSAAPSVAGSVVPKVGGTLRFGGQGGGSTDSLEAQNVLTNTDYARAAMLYDPLVRLDDSGQPQLVLAESIEANADATEWTIRIHDKVLTHDGNPFGASDVLYSFKRIMQNKFSGALSIGPINLAQSKVLDARTVLLKYDGPFAILTETLALVYYYMVPQGYDPRSAVGTGPFKLKNFTPGVDSTFVKNDAYWMDGLPYLDGIVTTNVQDETTQVNGLQAGQFDAVNYLSAASVAALQGSGFPTVIAKTGSWGPFTVRIDKTPFSDVRVRTALKLVIDRQQMLQQVFGGYGSIGNDNFGTLDADFTSLPQRSLDIAQAKSLLNSAGQSDLAIELVTTENAPGQVPAAEVFATQAKLAGISVKITHQSPTDYFAKSYLNVPFSQDYVPYSPYLVSASQATITGAPYNATHQADPAYDKLYQSAIAETDPSKRKAIVYEMVQYDHDKGGNIIPYFFPSIDGISPKLRGVTASSTGMSLGGYNFRHLWLDQ